MDAGMAIIIALAGQPVKRVEPGAALRGAFVLRHTLALALKRIVGSILPSEATLTTIILHITSNRIISRRRNIFDAESRFVN